MKISASFGTAAVPSVLLLAACSGNADVTTETVTETVTALASTSPSDAPWATPAAASGADPTETMDDSPLPARSTWEERQVGEWDVERAARFSSVVDLRDAAVASGHFECPDWDHSDAMVNAVESAECSDDSMLSVFDDSDAMREQLELELEMRELFSDRGLSATGVLVGYNWLLKTQDAPELQGDLGGTLLEDFETMEQSADVGGDSGELSDDLMVIALEAAWNEESEEDQEAMCLFWDISPEVVLESFQEGDGDQLPEEMVEAFFDDVCD